MITCFFLTHCTAGIALLRRGEFSRITLKYSQASFVLLGPFCFYWCSCTCLSFLQLFLKIASKIYVSWVECQATCWHWHEHLYEQTTKLDFYYGDSILSNQVRGEYGLGVMIFWRKTLFLLSIYSGMCTSRTFTIFWGGLSLNVFKKCVFVSSFQNFKCFLSTVVCKQMPKMRWEFGFFTWNQWRVNEWDRSCVCGIIMNDI